MLTLTVLNTASKVVFAVFANLLENETKKLKFLGIQYWL